MSFQICNESNPSIDSLIIETYTINQVMYVLFPLTLITSPHTCFDFSYSFHEWCVHSTPQSAFASSHLLQPTKETESKASDQSRPGGA